jgi:hypothetical protein
MDQPLRKERIAQARAEIAKRIKRFCQTLPQSEFDQLLDRMAECHCKYEVFPNLPELAAAPDPDRILSEQIRTLEKPITF